MTRIPERSDRVHLPIEVSAECDQLASAVSAEGRLPALVAAASADGTIVWQHQSRYQDGQFRVGSITKTMTAVAVMQLRDAGKVDIDVPIAHHVPDAPAGHATIRQLLSHTAGLSAEPAGHWWEHSPGQTWAELRAANSGIAAVVPPGARLHYSNLGYALLGELIARTHGCAWFDVIRSRVLNPLGLRRTSYLPMNNEVAGTSRRPDGRLVAEPAYDFGAMGPAGQLWSTAADLSRWAHFLVTGADEVLSATTLEEMATVHSGDPGTQHRGAYGLGMRLWWRGQGTLRGHTGSVPGFLAGIAADPDSGVAAVALANVTTGLDSAELITRLIEVVEPTSARRVRSARTAPVDLPDWVWVLAGDWYHGNTRSEITFEGGELVLTGPSGIHHFRVSGPDRLRGRNGYFAGEELQVRRRDDGSVSHLDVVTFLYSRVPYDPRTPVPGSVPRLLSGWP